MSRAPRFSYAHALHHVTLRCNNREFLFAEPSFELCCNTVAECRAKFPLHLFHYCLMTNHVHLLFQVGLADTLSRAMHWLSTNFSRRVHTRALALPELLTPPPSACSPPRERRALTRM